MLTCKFHENLRFLLLILLLNKGYREKFHVFAFCTNTYRDQCGEEAKKFRIKDANSYLCLAGKSKIDGHQAGGVAKGGSICDKNIAMRVLFVGYAKFGGPMGMEFTPQQASLETGNVLNDIVC